MDVEASSQCDKDEAEESFWLRVQKNKAALQSSVVQHRQESGDKHKGRISENKEGRRKEKKRPISSK